MADEGGATKINVSVGNSKDEKEQKDTKDEKEPKVQVVKSSAENQEDTNENSQSTEIKTTHTGYLGKTQEKSEDKEEDEESPKESVDEKRASDNTLRKGTGKTLQPSASLQKEKAEEEAQSKPAENEKVVEDTEEDQGEDVEDSAVAPTVAELSNQQGQTLTTNDSRDYRINPKNLKKPPSYSPHKTNWGMVVLFLVLVLGIAAVSYYYIQQLSV